MAIFRSALWFGKLALLALPVAVTIVLIESILLRSTELSLWLADESTYLRIHGVIDVFAVWFAIVAALVIACELIRRLGADLKRIVGLASLSALISVAFTLLVIPIVILREWLHPFLDRRLGLSPSDDADPWLCSFAALTAELAASSDNTSTFSLFAALDNGLRGALLENAILLPIVLSSLALLALYHRRKQISRIHLAVRNLGYPRRRFIGAAAVVALCAFALAMVASMHPWSKTHSLLVTATPFYPAAWASQPTRSNAEDDPCESGATPREYFVEAHNIQMILNRFGDRDEHAYMYVGGSSQQSLDRRLNGIYAQIGREQCTNWGGEGRPHLPCVANGLNADPEFGEDLLQPLIMRATVGECVVIHFTNRLLDESPFPGDRTSNGDVQRPDDGRVSLALQGLAHTAIDSDGQTIAPKDAFANRDETITYRIPIPRDPSAERAYHFRDGGGNRERVAHGLFGALVVEPAGAAFLDTTTGEELADGIGWQAIIDMPDGERDFREFVLMYHEVGDEDFAGIIDGANVDNGTPQNDQPLPALGFEGDPLIGPLYRLSGRAINYRSESFHHRLTLDKSKDDLGGNIYPYEQLKSLGYSSYTFGDPATPMPRSYLGEPTKTRLLHGGSEVFHVHHLHGGGDRWRRNPNADPNNDISGGLTKKPAQNVLSIHLDSQTIGPGTSYNLEHECGAGGCQQAAGDFLYHCHVGQHYLAGMWGFWRVFDTLQDDLAPLPDMDAPVEAVESHELVGRTIGDRTIVLDDPDLSNNEISLASWVETQLPPRGQRLDDDDATTWDWSFESTENGPRYLGEPETSATWANYESEAPGERPSILFNPTNGRYAWPLFRPHLGKRPPFAPNGHTGTPWLPADGVDEDSIQHEDALCPDPEMHDIDVQNIQHYPISAVLTEVFKFDDDVDDSLRRIDGAKGAKIFTLNEDIIPGSEDSSGKITLVNSADQKSVQPLAIRSGVGDCVRIIFTSKLKDELKFDGKVQSSKVNMHTHFVQFDPQASDGVITGFSYEQSVRPYSTERAPAPDGATRNHERRILTEPAETGTQAITVNQAYRLRKGVWIGIGLGEGMCDGDGACGPHVDKVRPHTEIRKIVDCPTATPRRPDAAARTDSYSLQCIPDEPMEGAGVTLTLDKPLENAHQAGESVGVEFVQYSWYSDVDTGTVFWHDHVDFNSWDLGLVGAHVIEPPGSTWHDPVTGEMVRSGNIVDVRAPEGSSIGAGQYGPFREFVLFNHKTQSERADFGTLQSSINLKAEPIQALLTAGTSVLPRTGLVGRKGEPAHWFSSVKHGDPFTPMPRAYVGDPLVIRLLGVQDRFGGLRVTGHRVRLERWADTGSFSDTVPIGISERFDALLDGGAGGTQQKAGDYLYYNTVGRDALDGAWGLLRVYNSMKDGSDGIDALQPLPGRTPPDAPPDGETVFPPPGEEADAADIDDNTGPSPVPAPAAAAGTVCPSDAPERAYDVHIREAAILRRSVPEDVDVGMLTPGDFDPFDDGVVYSFDPPALVAADDLVQEPLILRVNQGECLVVNVTNHLGPRTSEDPRDGAGRAGLSIGELPFDPQTSYGAAIGLNHDSSIAPQPGAAPTVSAVEPEEGGQGETLETVITGENFQADAELTFGPGITVNEKTAVSATQIDAEIAVDAGATLGERTVTVTNPDGQSASLDNAFAVIPPPAVAPTVAEAAPDVGAPGDTLNVTVIGTGFQDGADVDFGAGITINATAFVSATELTADITIDAVTVPGARTITVTNPDGEEGSLAGAFAVAGAREITITGTGDPVDWTAEVDGVAVPAADDNRVTITVRPGDEITWLVSASTHGVVFESQAQMEALLDIAESETLAARPQSAGGQDLFDGNGFGTGQHDSVTELMRATVKDVADLTQTLDFTCFVHGPTLMNGTLVFEQTVQPAPEVAEAAPAETLDVTAVEQNVQDSTNRTYRYYADVELGTTVALNLANPMLAYKGALATVIVEPAGSRYVLPTDNGEGGVSADILDDQDRLLFREVVAVFHDGDHVIGHNRMAYPIEADCINNTLVRGDDDQPAGCAPTAHSNWAFSSVNYRRNPWRDRSLLDQPSDVYSSILHGDPGLLFSGAANDPLRIRVAAPWGEQPRVFALAGHRWPLEPGMHKPAEGLLSEMVFSRLLPPGYSFDAPVAGGFGGTFGIVGDSILLDGRLPFSMAGSWGIARTTEPADPE